MHDSKSGLLEFSAPRADRLVSQRHDEAWLAQALTAPETGFVPVCRDEQIVLDEHGAPWLPQGAAGQTLFAAARAPVLLGAWQGRNYFALDLDDTNRLPAGSRLSSLRSHFGSLDDATLALFGYARAMIHWHRHTRYCGRCGTATVSRCAGHELHCPACHAIFYPRLNPAVIVLVEQGECCLLATQTAASPPRYSTLAGFVEPGETIEAAVRREVCEETDLRISHLQYQYSQPWPYPASLMLGFRATADTTEIRCRDGELLAARWFSREQLRKEVAGGQIALSTPHSIAWHLLRDWFDAQGDSLAAMCAATG